MIRGGNHNHNNKVSENIQKDAIYIYIYIFENKYYTFFVKNSNFFSLFFQPSVHQLPQRNNTTFKSWTNNNHSTNSEISEDYEDIEWKPISRHQKTRKPINGSGTIRNLITFFQHVLSKLIFS